MLGTGLLCTRPAVKKKGLEFRVLRGEHLTRVLSVGFRV